jgi:2-polyprenyl-3-methyl-5-hydroxy-6-metoxy-1,4-benzoquinol methylase
MGKEQPAAYYNAAYKKATEYKKHWSQSRYLRVWRRMIERFNANYITIDLGCGVGQTAEMMLVEMPVTDGNFFQYIGIDFSEEAIKMAKLKISGGTMHFIQSDLFDYIKTVEVDELAKKYIQFFCSETLEHIEKDVELLDLLRTKFPGSRIAISVPTFDDPGHVRHFKSTKEAKDRYSPFIKIDDTSQIGPWIIIQGILHI